MTWGTPGNPDFCMQMRLCSDVRGLDYFSLLHALRLHEVAGGAHAVLVGTGSLVEEGVSCPESLATEVGASSERGSAGDACLVPELEKGLPLAWRTPRIPRGPLNGLVPSQRCVALVEVLEALPHLCPGLLGRRGGRLRS